MSDEPACSFDKVVAPLPDSPEIRLTSPPSNGEYVAKQQPETPVSVQFTVLDWEPYPAQGKAVYCYLDGTYDGMVVPNADEPLTYEFPDIPLGLHQLCCSLVENGLLVGGCPATDCVDIRVTTSCVSDGDCNDGNPCSEDDCFEVIPFGKYECRYTPVPDPFCCVSPLDCFCADGMYQPCLEPDGGPPRCMSCIVHEDCDDGDQCTDDACDNGLCSHVWQETTEGKCCQ